MSDPNQSGDEPTLDHRDSNPNSAEGHGLSGAMGVSSERTGPAGPDPRTRTAVEGTGSRGSAVTDADGTFDISPTEWDAPDVSGLPESEARAERPPSRDA